MHPQCLTDVVIYMVKNDRNDGLNRLNSVSKMFVDVLGQHTRNVPPMLLMC